MVVVHPRTFVVARANTDPGRETLLGREGRGYGANFSNDLLRSVRSQTGNLHEPLDSVLVRAEQTGYLLVQLADLLFEELQLFQGHLQKSAVHGLEVRRCVECVAQLFPGGAQTLVRQSSQGCWVGFTFGEGFQDASSTGA